jgi:hypothetical protein
VGGSRHFGAAVLLVAGAADESAGADDMALSGDAAGGVLSPHAGTTRPTATIAAKSARIAMFFMIVVLLRGTPSERRGWGLLCLSSTGAVNCARLG